MADPTVEGARLAEVHRLRPRRRLSRRQWSRRRLSLRQWPLGLVLLGVAVALALVAADHFRRGAVLLSASVLMAFFLRLLLPEPEAGLLAVRSRRVDLAVLGVLALSLALFSVWVPTPA